MQLTLLDGAKLFSEILVSRSRGHLFQCGFPTCKVLEPLIDLFSYHELWSLLETRELTFGRPSFSSHTIRHEL